MNEIETLYLENLQFEKRENSKIIYFNSYTLIKQLIHINFKVRTNPLN